MDSPSVHQFLSIYAWLGLIALVFLMALIARFYERLSGQHTYYRWFTLPIVLFTGATMRQIGLDRITGEGWGDLLMALSGLALAMLCLHIYRQMTSGH